MGRFFYNLLTSGIKEKLTPEQLVKIVSLNAMMILGASMMAFFGIRDLIQEHWLVGIVVSTLAAVVYGVFFFIRLTRNIALGGYVITIIAMALFTYLTWSGSNEGSGSLWMNVFPIIAYFLLGQKVGSWFVLGFFLHQMLLFFVPGYGNLVLPLDFKARLIGSFIIISLYSLAFETIRNRAQTEIEKSRQSLEETAIQLEEAKIRTDGILAHVNEGIFLLNEKYEIEPQYSQELEVILGEAPLAGRNFLDVLRGKIPEPAWKASQDYFEMFFGKKPNLTLLAEINPLDPVVIPNPQRPDFPEKHLAFSFTLIRLEKGALRLLGTVRDQTDSIILSQKLKAEEDRSARQMKSLFQIIHVRSDLMGQFLEDAQAEIHEVNRLLKNPPEHGDELLVHLFQAVHAIKGNAVLLGLKSFADRAHGLEEKIQHLRQRPFEWAHLLTVTVDLSVLQSELDDIRGLIQRVAGFNSQMLENQGRDLLLMTMEKTVERLCQDLGRKAVLDIGNFHPEWIPGELRKGLKDILVQLVRNSLVHGLESEADRLQRGKEGPGKVLLSTEVRGSELVVSYQDDGRGLDEAKIRSKAQELGIWKDAWAGDPQKILALIFQPGFSTAEGLDLHGGRGMGMGLIKQRIEKMGGALKIRNQPGKSLTFEFRFPLPTKDSSQK